jgi:proline iminopeptidase
MEYLIEHDNLFENLNYNLILYDQRGCGRSVNARNENVSHNDNINDLLQIYQYFEKNVGINILGFIGHSYGAKLLFDFYHEFKLNVPYIFVATASSILTPRLNNLMLDFAYLKKTNSVKYNQILSSIDTLDLKTIWKLTEDLAPIFQENKDRNHFYWADLDYFEKVKKIENMINLSYNADVFMNIRKDIYSKEEKFSVDISALSIPYLWINGFHDFIMNESENFLSKNVNRLIFHKSAHFPHFEENNRFCSVVNDFLKKQQKISNEKI